MQTIRVELRERAYPIHIGKGILDEVSLYAPHLRDGRAAIVSNAVVAPLYLKRLQGALTSAGANAISIVVEDGEQAKDWRTLDRVFDALLDARCDRQTVIVALGGGVIGDLAGFAAAVYQRGIAFIQVPTTLLAQVDSSVGGKTAINHPRGKNMIGAFHQPRAVISDVATLDTLPVRELRAGLAEVIKHGLALDVKFAEWLEANVERLLARDPEALTYAVQRSCELKAQVVAADEHETDQRALLNFGHTFGHAIETGLGYGTWLHGEAVAAGMVMAAELSARNGMIDQIALGRIRDLVSRAGLPVAGPDMSPDRYLELMAIDKKVARGRIRFVVLEGIGRSLLRADLDERKVREAISAATSAAAAAPH
ncbi:MAG: 3-dehydroquinate synthase [Sulfuricaulis sp.]|uniref:3-dehydroquinate synthase n=1 Tax=Sulfuricaulis sp. TaxID=2003553 RepID=UPI003C4B8FC0